MNQILAIFEKPQVARISVLAVAAIVIIAGISGFGFWEPLEIDSVERVAELKRKAAGEDQAGALAKARPWDLQTAVTGWKRVLKTRAATEARHAKLTPAKRRAAEKKQPTLASQALPLMGLAELLNPPTPPTLSERLSAFGQSSFGRTEFGARIPLALCGWALIVVTFLFGLRLGNERSGLIAALVALSFPLLLFQSKHVIGDIGTALGHTCLVFGAIGLMWPRAQARSFLLMDIFLALAGGALAYLGSGLLLGIVVPSAAIALCGTVLCLRRQGPEEPVQNLTRIAAGTAVFGAVALVSLIVFTEALFLLEKADVGERHLFGYTLEPAKGYFSVLRGSWQTDGNLAVNVSSLFEQVAFGCFPWIVIAPLAVGRLGFGGKMNRKRWGGMVLFTWAAASWLVAGIYQRKVGPTMYPAIAGIAVAVGVWVDERLSARKSDNGDENTLPLVGLFAFFGALVLAKNLSVMVYEIKKSPLRITELLRVIDFNIPEKSDSSKGILLFGIVFGLCAAFGFALREGKKAPPHGWLAYLARARRVFAQYGLVFALGLSTLFAFVIAHVTIPRVAEGLSSKRSFDVLVQARKGNEPVGILGKVGAGPEFYAKTELTKLRGHNELYEFLGRDERVFALAPGRDLCRIHAAQGKRGFAYHVLEDSNEKRVLLSNKLGGAKDKNKLSSIITRERPSTIGTATSYKFNNQIELIGFSAPAKVGRGDTFAITLFFKVIGPIRKNWNVLLHFDGASQRFQGDHKPHETFCGTSQWKVGDYIADTVTVKAGSISYPKTQYQIWTGFFTGQAGDWTNMKITSGNGAKDNRALVGTIKID